MRGEKNVSKPKKMKNLSILDRSSSDLGSFLGVMEAFAMKLATSRTALKLIFSKLARCVLCVYLSVNRFRFRNKNMEN